MLFPLKRQVLTNKHSHANNSLWLFSLSLLVAFVLGALSLPSNAFAQNSSSQETNSPEIDYTTPAEVYHTLQGKGQVNVYCLSYSCIEDAKPFSTSFKIVEMHNTARFNDIIIKVERYITALDQSKGAKSLKTLHASDTPTTSTVLKDWKRGIKKDLEIRGGITTPVLVIAQDMFTNKEQVKSLYNVLKKLNPNTVVMDTGKPLFYKNGKPTWESYTEKAIFYLEYINHHFYKHITNYTFSLGHVVLLVLGAFGGDYIMYLLLGLVQFKTSGRAFMQRTVLTVLGFVGWTLWMVAFTAASAYMYPEYALGTNPSLYEILENISLTVLLPFLLMLIVSFVAGSLTIPYSMYWMSKEPKRKATLVETILALWGYIKLETQPLVHRLATDVDDKSQVKEFYNGRKPSKELSPDVNEHQKAAFAGSDKYKLSRSYVPHQGFLATGGTTPKLPDGMFEVSKKWIIRSNHKEGKQGALVVNKDNIRSAFYKLHQDADTKGIKREHCSYWLTPYIEFESHGFIRSHADNQMLDVEFGVAHVTYSTKDVHSVNLSREHAKETKLTSDVLALLVDVEKKEGAPVEVGFGVTHDGKVAITNVKRQKLDATVSNKSHQSWRELNQECKYNHVLNTEIENHYSSLGRSVLSMISNGNYFFQGSVQYRVVRLREEKLDIGAAIKAKYELFNLLDKVNEISPYIGVRGVLEHVNLILRPIMEARLTRSQIHEMSDAQRKELKCVYFMLRGKGKLLPYLDLNDDYYSAADNVFMSGVAITESLLMVGVAIAKTAIEQQYPDKKFIDVSYESLAKKPENWQVTPLCHSPKIDNAWWTSGKLVNRNVRDTGGRHKPKCVFYYDEESLINAMNDNDFNKRELYNSVYVGKKIPKPLESSLMMFNTSYLRDVAPNSHVAEMLKGEGFGLYVGVPHYERCSVRLKN